MFSSSPPVRRAKVLPPPGPSARAPCLLFHRVSCGSVSCHFISSLHGPRRGGRGGGGEKVFLIVRQPDKKRKKKNLIPGVQEEVKTKNKNKNKNKKNKKKK
ncbi:hypothetical protein E2C01_074403 [Portunus trituberculatus]|uniref:Uncharacterized protein n=1 Tax=Portunus trituberculatus TaxID=210409 RepID=A0A5B7I3A1_PORTR|nr:hypothetical protein [Portunus trituberculatus]